MWAVQRGVAASFLELHPLITVRLGDRPAVALDDESGCMALIKERRRERWEAERGQAAADDEDLPEGEWREEYDDETLPELRLAADWEAIQARLPPLDAPLLQPGEWTARAREVAFDRPRRSYLFRPANLRVRFGSYEVECGVTLPGPLPFQPPPAPADEESEPEDEDELDEV